MEGTLRIDKTLIVRALLLLLLATVLPFLPPQPADARVCANGEIADTCQTQRCREDLNGCYPDPPIAPPGSCGDSYLLLHPPLSIRGSVFGPGRAGVADACVYWFMTWTNGSTSYGSVATDDSGLFTIDIAADATTMTVYASKAHMTWDSEVVTATAYALDPDKRAELEISYTQSVSVAPLAFNSSQPRSVTVSVISAAPAASSRVLAEVNPGSILTLSRDITYTGPAPLSRWTANTTVPPGLSEGVKTVPTCILSVNGSGTCNGPGSDIVYSAVPPVGFKGFFAVDNTPPTLNSVSPKNLHNTTDSTPEIAATATDALSGPDVSRGSLLLDGVTLSNSPSGTPSSPLSVGVHSVTATIWDLAGNSAEVGWQFAVTSLTGGLATVTVTPKTVSVPPQGLPGFCCQYVTFSNVKTKLSESDLTLRGSPLWNGVGTVSRHVSHEALRVTFKSAAQEMTVPANAYSRYLYDIAVLEPSPDDLVVGVPPRDSAIDVGVYVPQGFIMTNDTTATVWAAAQNIVTSTVYPIVDSDPIPYVMPSCAAGKCNVEGAITCALSSSTYGCNGTNPRTHLERTDPTGRKDIWYVFGQVNLVNTDVQKSTTYDKYPNLNPAENVSGSYPNCGTSAEYRCFNLIDGSDATRRLTAHWATGNLFRSYGTQWYIGVSNTATPAGNSHVLAWMAADAQPGSVMAAGSNVCKISRINEFGNSLQSALSEWTTGSSAVSPTVGVLYSVWPTKKQNVGPISRPVNASEPTGALVYKIGATNSFKNASLVTIDDIEAPAELMGDFSNELGQISDAKGLRVNGNGLWSSWQPTVDDRTTPPIDYGRRAAEVITGAEFTPTSGVRGDYSFVYRLFFEFQLTDSSAVC